MAVMEANKKILYQESLGKSEMSPGAWEMAEDILAQLLAAAFAEDNPRLFGTPPEDPGPTPPSGRHGEEDDRYS